MTAEHWYAESGCNFCGFGVFSDGEMNHTLCGELERDEEDEDGITFVTGPDWIVNNIGHIGG